ncbi:MAG: alanine--tRNA ligase [Caldisericia bacterium]|nr:alanine--tRNA ligase [Caldisericia bacterium]
MKSQDIRDTFLSFFADRGHYKLESASLLPQDPTVMFTLAGMVPLKPYFTGERKPISTRLVSVQRCVRTNDIDNVGKSPFHHTFFEMLGNFSIGDYFKNDAIPWAWEYLTKVVQLPAERLLVTVNPEDEESIEIWKKVGLKPEQIQFDPSNFWMMGDVGPCGPDSEIYFDFEPGKPLPMKDGIFDSEGRRFLELWNVVFTQFDAKADGTKAPLPRKNIDTGAGLERICSVSQNVRSSMETDLFIPTMNALNEIAKTDENQSRKNLICDHIRACTFMISDGVFPSNEGRGYILKRLTRRAALAGRKIGIERAFLSDLVPSVINNYNQAYPFLTERKEAVIKILTSEEAQFHSTLAMGLQILSDELTKLKEKKGLLSGATAFKLYDTYGFPIDLTKEVAEEEGVKIDEEGFKAELESQKERGRRSYTGQKEFERSTALIAFRDETGASRFVGYQALESSSKVLGIMTNHGSLPQVTEENQVFSFTVESTPFYPEKGGQIGDAGFASNDNCQVEIIDTTTPVDGLILHKAKITKGVLKVGDTINLKVDINRRKSITRAHTATHILHTGLHNVLGGNASQAGSWVGEEELRFDFSHTGDITNDDLAQIERFVNEQVTENIAVDVSEHDLEEAKKLGAIALFGEKYGSRVRVVQIPQVSMELCGGCHVEKTGDIGTFKIISEASIGANLRRIEAKVGGKAIRQIQEDEDRLDKIGTILGAGSKQALEKVEFVLTQLDDMTKRNRALVSSLAKINAEQSQSLAKRFGSTNVIIARTDGFDMEGVRLVADFSLDCFDHGVSAILSKLGDKCYLCVISKGIPFANFHSGKLITKVGSICGFKGGGKPDLGQAGGIAPENADQVLSTIELELKNLLG